MTTVMTATAPAAVAFDADPGAYLQMLADECRSATGLSLCEFALALEDETLDFGDPLVVRTLEMLEAHLW